MWCHNAQRNLGKGQHNILTVIVSNVVGMCITHLSVTQFDMPYSDSGALVNFF